jgi:hypothetical protein
MRKFKRPDVKVPVFLSDLYHDLKERRLLPLVVLILVAIVAVPFLLSDSGSSRPQPAPVRSPGPSSDGAPAAMAIVRATPGLREPSKRLEHRRPKDPFVPKHVSPALSEQPVTTQTSHGGGNGVGGSAPGAGGSVPATPGTSGQSGVVFFTTAAKVKITRSETKPNDEVVHEDPVIRPRVLPGTTLLGEKAQVVTYMGASPKTRNPTFLISDQVSAVFGEGHCLAGTETCQLIELIEGEPEVFIYGANDIRYRIAVLSTEIVVTGRTDRPSTP